MLAYTYWPTHYTQLDIPSINANTQHITLIAHGLNDTAASWSDPLKTILQEQHTESKTNHAQIISLDWNPYSQSTFRCSIDGKRIGALLGKKISTSTQLHSAHLIAHSCGSFVILGLCESLKTHSKNIQVQTTYLDPVSIYGGIFWNYGLRHFGSCADFSDAYIDHQDNVPGSDKPLPKSHTFDVTAARKKTNFNQSPHIWPTVYYQLLVAAGTYPSLNNTSAINNQYPRGQFEVVKQLPK